MIHWGFKLALITPVEQRDKENIHTKYVKKKNKDNNA